MGEVVFPQENEVRISRPTRFGEVVVSYRGPLFAEELKNALAAEIESFGKTTSVAVALAEYERMDRSTKQQGNSSHG